MPFSRFRGFAASAVVLLLVTACADEVPRPASSGVGAASASNILTPAEADEGWSLLFDGASLEGWRGIGRDDVPEGHWLIEADALHKVASGDVPLRADGQPRAGGDLMTLQAYDDFEMSFEWKVDSAANSGIKYNVSEAMSTEQGGGNALGFEYQILDDDAHPDARQGVDGNRTAGGLYDLIAPRADKPLAPVGEWNTGRIVFDDGHGEHWLNGVKVVEYDLDSPRFDSLLAASKYAPIEGFATRRTGHIVLQDHNDDVWYRNIKIRPLD